MALNAFIGIRMGENDRRYEEMISSHEAGHILWLSPR